MSVYQGHFTALKVESFKKGTEREGLDDRNREVLIKGQRTSSLRDETEWNIWN